MSETPTTASALPDETSEPVELRAPRGATHLTLVWSNGAEVAYRHALLRGMCPCAHCQGHQGPVRWAAEAGDADLPLIDVEEVGNYAVRLVWGDGHGTGLYTFRFLRGLAPVARRADTDAGLAWAKTLTLPR
jgi:DUF971 family protein